MAFVIKHLASVKPEKELAYVRPVESAELISIWVSVSVAGTPSLHGLVTFQSEDATKVTAPVRSIMH